MDTAPPALVALGPGLEDVCVVSGEGEGMPFECAMCESTLAPNRFAGFPAHFSDVLLTYFSFSVCGG
jgi:hypothetical protein